MANRLRQTVQSIEATPAEQRMEAGGDAPNLTKGLAGGLQSVAEILGPQADIAAMVEEARRAGSSFSKGDYLDAAGSMGLAAIAPLMMATPGSVKSVREISERALDSFKQLSFPGKKTNWWLDELEDKGTVTLYHGTNIKNLDKIKEEGLKVDRKGYTYATPDPDTGVGYSVMARGEKASKGKKGKAYEQAPREERALLEIEVPREMLERNIPLQRSPTSKEKLFSDKGLEKFNKSERMKIFGQENVPMDKKYNTPFYDLTEVRFKEPISPEMIKGYSIKPETRKTNKSKGGSVIESNPYNYQARAI